MKVITEIDEVRELAAQWRKGGRTIGLVPTMGYLHDGHASLIKRAAEENDCVVVSIFVNPIQFGPKEDLSTYPRDLDRDSDTVSQNGGDLIFFPDAAVMYGENFSTHVDVDGITALLCGEKRPGHFRGVATVVTKLFNIVRPDKAYFGQKDAQQLAVIKRMVQDLNIDIEIVGCPIIREADGLAMSSRNAYLSGAERTEALVLSRALHRCKQLFDAGNRDTGGLKAEMMGIINSTPSSKIDYIEIVDSTTFNKTDRIDGSTLVALAVYIGKTRLIDNMILKPVVGGVE